MLAQISSLSLNGLNVNQIKVEIDASLGLPSWDIVGLPDTAVKESKERVKSAIKNSGYEFPTRKIVVNLAPADIKKEGPNFDLPIAIAILVATGQILPEKISDFYFIGELGLDGTLRKSKGALSFSLFLKHTKAKLIVPKENGYEASMGGCLTYAFNDLKEIVHFFNTDNPVQPLVMPNFLD